MGILLWIVLGAASAAIAKPLMPGPDPAGIGGTILIGIFGGLVGGAVGMVLPGIAPVGFDFRSLITAVTGSWIALFCYRSFAMRGMA